MPNETLTEQESLAIIQQMIAMAKKEQQDDGKSWIIWGWLLFSVSILTVINLHLHLVSTFFFWNIFSVITIVLFVLRYFKRPKKVKTYTCDLYDKLNIGFLILICFVIVAMNANAVSVLAGFAILMSAYGFWALIYGAVINFMPSIIGAFVTWIFAFAALFVKSFEWVMVLHAAAVLAGYIVPGHLANIEFRKTAVQ